MNYYRDFDFKKAISLISMALEEDIGTGDITTDLLVNKSSVSKAELLIKQDGVIAGLKIFRLVYELLDKNVKINFLKKDGDRVKKGNVIGIIRGNTGSLLKGERTALNILQRMSGIATLTDEMIRVLNNKSVKLLDTRKTTPNFRLFEKAAVKIGGGTNHRSGLYDMYLIKDNHIEANGGIKNTIKVLQKNKKNRERKTEIEVKNLKELKIVMANGGNEVDRIMLDNFRPDQILKAVKMNKGKYEIEISGGVNKRNIGKYGKLKGIDFISAGFLTHSPKSLDISLNFIT